MKTISSLKYLQLSRLSQPACDRVLYRMIKKFKVRSILEIGLGDGNRAVNMIHVAQKYGSSNSVRYTGIDLFEGRSGGKTPLKLVEAHKVLKATNAKSQLVPGTVGSSVSKIANSHVRTDLIVIPAGYDPSELESVWFFFPRMLHAESLIFLQPANNGNANFELLNRLEIERRVKKIALEKKKSAVAA